MQSKFLKLKSLKDWETQRLPFSVLVMTENLFKWSENIVIPS